MAQSNQKVLLEPACLLHQRPYRDSSLLLEVFTRQHGRVGLVARGVKGKKRQRQALLQPFSPLLLSWSGRGELGTLTDVEANGAAHRLEGQVLLSGFYLNELLTHLLHRHDPHPDLFDYYLYTLVQLDGLTATDNLHLQQLLRLFEKELLQEIGYGLVLEHEVEQGEVIDPEADYCYLPGLGPRRAVATDTVRFKGRSLLAFTESELADAESLKDAKRLTRLVLDYYLGGRKLHSRQLLLDLQRTSEGAALGKRQV
jgi:DNA repair protein RecO (recombination protein O)